MLRLRSSDETGVPAGVYVFKHKTRGELYVGSSINLIVRVRDHYYALSHG
jgi:predicted GIY-YIG superfamily endonuclease